LPDLALLGAGERAVRFTGAGEGATEAWKRPAVFALGAVSRPLRSLVSLNWRTDPPIDRPASWKGPCRHRRATAGQVAPQPAPTRISGGHRGDGRTRIASWWPAFFARPRRIQRHAAGV